MYRPSSFREDRPEILVPAMREIGFACVVSRDGDGLSATHVPVVVKHAADDGIAVEFHVARANPHRLAAGGEGDTLAIFQGPQTYIHPGWYPGKSVHGRVVPTWCYVTIHAHGRLVPIEGEDQLRRHLDDLTSIHEMNRETPWAVSDAPEDHIDKLSRAIAGMRLEVERLEGAYKLNQNKSDADRLGVIEGLQGQPEGDARRIARLMKDQLAARQ